MWVGDGELPLSEVLGVMRSFWFSQWNSTGLQPGSLFLQVFLLFFPLNSYGAKLCCWLSKLGNGI